MIQNNMCAWAVYPKPENRGRTNINIKASIERRRIGVVSTT